MSIVPEARKMMVKDLKKYMGGNCCDLDTFFNALIKVFPITALEHSAIEMTEDMVKKGIVKIEEDTICITEEYINL